MLKLLKKLGKNNKGTAVIEYGFLAGLIAVAAIVSMQALGVSLNSIYDGIASASDAASGDGGNNGKGNNGKGKGKGKGPK